MQMESRDNDIIIGIQQQANNTSLVNSSNNNNNINNTNSSNNINSNLNQINVQNGDVNNSSNNNNNNTNNSTNGNNSTNSNNSDRSSSTNGSVYTMPGILHYLQHEWNRFEFDRQQWELERAELMAKISFLQGERRGQENLKQNLIRRIKMLELALKQERIKYHKLKFGVDPPNLNQSSSNSSSADTNIKNPSLNNNTNNNNNENTENNDLENSTFSISQHPILNKENSTTNATKQGRQLLKQYLQEIGYTDTIIDIRSARLRALLGLKQQANQQSLSSITDSIDILSNTTNALLNNQLDPLSNLINGNKQLLQFSNNNNNSNNSAGNNKNRLNITNSGTQMLNGTSEVQRILKLSDSNSTSGGNNMMTPNNDSTMLMMTNLGFIDSNSSNSSSKLGSITNNTNNDDELNDDDNNLGDGGNITIQNGQKQTLLNDQDTEDALKEFSFLSNESSSSDDSSDWNVDKDRLTKLTEQYKKDRKSKSSKQQQQQQQEQQQQQQQSLGSHVAISSQRPNRAALQAMIANITENNSNNDSGSSSVQISKSDSPNSEPQKLNSLTFSNNPKLFSEDQAFANDAALGELSRISLGNSNNDKTVINDETIIDPSLRKTISSKFSLRGHFDAVRCLAFHPTESALITGSEDQTIKLWNLDKSALSSKKNSNLDIEPIYTFRQHKSPVLSVLISANGDYCISSGLDSKIIIWNIPNYETTDQYDIYSPNVFVKNLNGHTDAVWSMALVDNTLVSVSSDCTVRLWNPFSADELNEASSTSISVLNQDKAEGIPTSVDFINTEASKIVTSFGSSHHNLYDTETSKIITRFDYSEEPTDTHCYKVISHPSTATINSSLIVSAHEDKKIRFFDINSGKLVYQMVAHQDACTDLAIDPTCFYLISASHDCSIRLWNLDNKNCIQEMTSHRKKYDESIHCVAFHPTKPYVASGGADAIVKIYS